jgi:predicted alpha/beta hydrolase family esterase
LSGFFITGRLAFLLAALLLAGCAGPSQFISHSFPGGVPDGLNLPEPEKHILLIFNHGSLEEEYGDICSPTAWTVPEVVRQLSGKTVNGLDIVVYNFCSTSAGKYDAATRSGEPKVVKRVESIEALVRAFQAAGVPPHQIFLVGHSAGGWASLLAARRQHVKFNAVIAFAPAFAGKKADRSPGWEDLRQRQAGLLADAGHIDGLVYAYADDPYESSADLAFLGKIDGIRLVRLDGQPDGDGERCAGPYGHRTAFRACFARSQKNIILDYIASRLAEP